MSAHTHEPAPVPTSPNVNLEIPITDPAWVDPKFTDNYSPVGPVFTTQKPAYQKPGTKDAPATYGVLSDAYAQHNFTSIPQIGPEASLVPEVSVDDRARSIASYALWLVNNHEPRGGKIRRMLSRKPKLPENTSVDSLVKAMGAKPDESKKFTEKLLKAATDHNTVATISAQKIVGALSSPKDSVVPEAVQELGQIITDKGVYGKTRRKARANQRKVLQAVSHSVGGAIAQGAAAADDRLKPSKAGARETRQKHHDTHHADEFLSHDAPRVNRGLATRHSRSLAKEIRRLVGPVDDDEVLRQTYIRRAEELGLQDGNFRVRIGDKVETDWHIHGMSTKPDPKNKGKQIEFFELEGPKGKIMIVPIDKLLDWQFLTLY